MFFFFFVAHLGLDMILLSVWGQALSRKSTFFFLIRLNLVSRHDDHYKRVGYDDNDDHL